MSFAGPSELFGERAGATAGFQAVQLKFIAKGFQRFGLWYDENA